MSASRKDFVAIARELTFAKPVDNDELLLSFYERCCRAVANGLAQTNPQFDKQKFLNACEVRLRN